MRILDNKNIRDIKAAIEILDNKNIRDIKAAHFVGDKNYVSYVLII